MEGVMSDGDLLDAETRGRIRNDSDELLGAIDDIRRLERQKREVRMSSPEFHRRANEIERVARTVFGLAQSEREHGEDLSDTQENSIEDEADDEDDVNRHGNSA
jgi:hypothetical protein